MLLPAAAAARGGTTDMGDAPDGASTGYARGAAVGAFPSRSASGGPRHFGWRPLRIGPRADGERDSHQVDRDRHDDGAEAKLRACSEASRLSVGLNGRRLPPILQEAGKTIYVNAWFDWNRDGDWEDGNDGCANEWAIRNLAVPVSSLGADGIRLLPIAFKAGKQTRELWWRVTVSLDQPATDPGGRSLTGYALGETEDYFQRPLFGEPRFPDPTGEEERREKKGKPKLGVSCAPPAAVIPHGGTARIGFNIAAPGKGGPVFGAFAGVRPGGAKGFGTKLIPSKDQRGVSTGQIRAVGFAVKSSDVDPPVRFQFLTFHFVFTRGKTERTIKCFVLIVHEGGAKGKKHKHGKHRHPPKIPAVRCKGPCAEGPPPNPGPVITPTPPDNDPPNETPEPAVSGMAKITNIGGDMVQFEGIFNANLDRFALFFPGGFQLVDDGGAQSGGEKFVCQRIDFGGQPFSALSCTGSIKPGAQIDGGVKLNSNPPTDLQAQLFGYAGGAQHGPFPVDPLGF